MTDIISLPGDCWACRISSRSTRTCVACQALRRVARARRPVARCPEPGAQAAWHARMPLCPTSATPHTHARVPPAPGNSSDAGGYHAAVAPQRSVRTGNGLMMMMMVVLVAVVGC